MPLWWSFVLLMAIALGLAACDSPSMAFQSVPATRIDVAGSTFSVRHTAYEAEAIRINFEPGARRGAIVHKGVWAIEHVSGCTVVAKTLRGDTNLVASDLTCPGAPPRLPKTPRKRLDCTAYDGAGLAGDYIEIDCDITQTR